MAPVVWLTTGAGPRRYVCVVGAAPLQRHPTVLNSQPGRALNRCAHPTAISETQPRALQVSGRPAAAAWPEESDWPIDEGVLA